MKWRDRIGFVRSNMSKNKSRLFMTVLATAMGCSFLIMIASVAFGLQKSLIDDVTKGRTLTQIDLYGRTSGTETRGILAEDIPELRKVKHVRAVTAHTALPAAKASIGDYTGNINPLLVNINDEQNSGLLLSAGAIPANKGEVVVGYHFAEALIKANSPFPGTLIGKEITLQVPEVVVDENGNPPSKENLITAKFTIAGVLAKPDKEVVKDVRLLASDELYPTFMPQAYKQGKPLDLNEVNVYADNASHITEISKKLRAEGYSLYSAADSVKEMSVFFLVMKIGLIFVGTIAVLIASIGIYNTMTMAVTERAQDIGIMKAVGAHPRTIRSIFLLESSGIGMLGSIIGAVVAYALSLIVNTVIPPILSNAVDSNLPEGFQFSSIPPLLTLLSIGISMTVAILSGLRPARRATRIDVLSALRREI